MGPNANNLVVHPAHTIIASAPQVNYVHETSIKLSCIMFDQCKIESLKKTNAEAKKKELYIDKRESYKYFKTKFECYITIE